MSEKPVGLRYKVLEPMMFRKAGEFDPTSRGVYSSAASFGLPTPSTIGGALAYLIASRYPSKIGDGSWEEELKSVLGDIEIRGPYLVKGGRLLVAYGSKEGLDLGGVAGFARWLWDLARREPKEYDEIRKWMRDLEAWKDGIKAEALGRAQERVGVGLMVRSAGVKVADEARGLLYTAGYVDYATPRGAEVEVWVDAKGRLPDLQGWTPMRLGGEGRVAALYASQRTAIDAIREELWGGREYAAGRVALYIASPLLFRDRVSSNDELRDRVAAKLSGLCDAGSVEVFGEAGLLGAGYSVRRHKRKPIYLALGPGGLIFADLKGQCRLEDIYWCQLSEAGSQVGYGTVVPVPLPQG